MSKSTRNVIIIVAVVVAVGIAAVPFIVKATKAQKAPDVSDTSISEVTAPEEFTAPLDEESTSEILTEILTDLEQAQSTATTQQASSKNDGASTTVKSADATTTTKKNSKTTTTKPAKGDDSKTTTAAVDVGDGKGVVEGMADSAVVSYLYDPDGHFYYTEDNPWQRQFGFNLVYDWAAPITIMFYDTFRAKFDYDNIHWMIQGWKGQYGYLFVGCEIGVYTSSGDVSSSHYNCADDNHLINMEMTLYQNFNDGNGYTKLFTRTYYPHWWSTGFVDGHLTGYKFNDRSCLCLKARLTMYDSTMQAAFADALKACGFTQATSQDQLQPGNADAFYLSGEKEVYICWRTIDQGVSSR